MGKLTLVAVWAHTHLDERHTKLGLVELSVDVLTFRRSRRRHRTLSGFLVVVMRSSLLLSLLLLKVEDIVGGHLRLEVVNVMVDVMVVDMLVLVVILIVVVVMMVVVMVSTSHAV